MTTQFAIWFVRHGETVANRNFTIQGQTESPLTELGQEQAMACGRITLKSHCFTHVYSSDLGRAMDTCGLIMRSKSIQQPDVPIQKDVRLREKMYGCLEGKPSKLLHDAAQKANVSPYAYVADGGEDLVALGRRMKEAFLDICKRVRDEHTHSTGRMNAEFEESKPVLSNHIQELLTLRLNDNQVNHTKTHNIHAKQSPNTDGTALNITTDFLQPNQDLCANVLVVAHGGCLRELFRYFIMELHTPFPNGNGAALRPLPNTGVTGFLVTLSQNSQGLNAPLHLTCLCSHVNAHARGLEDHRESVDRGVPTSAIGSEAGPSQQPVKCDDKECFEVMPV